MQNAYIKFRDGDFFLTEMADDVDMQSLAVRMVAPVQGYLICTDSRHGGKHRSIVVNMKDVSYIILSKKD